MGRSVVNVIGTHVGRDRIARLRRACPIGGTVRVLTIRGIPMKPGTD
jgi:hypothetical protein